MTAPIVCQHCGEQLGSGAHWRYIVDEFPYNPEWSMRTIDAGQACSAPCLVALIEARHPERPTS